MSIQKYALLPIFGHHTIIFVYSLIKILQSKRRRIIVRIEYVLLICLLINLIFAWVSFIRFFPLVKSDIFCQHTINVLTALITCSKLSIYYFFLERLFLVSNYKQCRIILIRIILMFWMFTILCGILFGTKNECKYHHESQSCVSQFNPKYYTAAQILFSDLFIPTTISVTLSRRLLQLVKASNKNKKASNKNISSNESNINIQVSKSYMLLTKCILLSSVAMITTPFFMISATIVYKRFNILLFILSLNIDSTLNIWCILLTFNQYETFYHVLCVKLRCHDLVTRKCLLWFSCHYCCKIYPNGVNEQNEMKTDSVNEAVTQLGTELAITATESNNKTKARYNNSVNSESNIDSILLKPKQYELFAVYQTSKEECIIECNKLGINGENLDVIINHFEKLNNMI